MGHDSARPSSGGIRLAFALLLIPFSLPLAAQQLPNAPTPSSGATISGTVVDTNGNVVQNAKLTLSQEGTQGSHVQQSGSDGQFTFSNLPTGVFTVGATAPGMGTAQSSKIILAVHETRYLPQIVLPVVGSTTVHVVADHEQIAEQDVHIEETQRVLAVFPNFYSSFDWNAPSLNSRQKFKLAWRSLIDPTSLVAVAGIAGGEQIYNIYPGFGTGPEGYGKRFGAALANTVDSRILGSAVFPAIFRQDPRFFYKADGSIGSRAVYAAEQAVICRGDNGHEQFAYSHIMANFTAGAISNLYYPQQNRGASLVVENGLIEIGGAAATNLLREFVLPAFTTHAPGSAFKKH